MESVNKKDKKDPAQNRGMSRVSNLYAGGFGGSYLVTWNAFI